MKHELLVTRTSNWFDWVPISANVILRIYSSRHSYLNRTLRNTKLRRTKPKSLVHLAKLGLA